MQEDLNAGITAEELAYFKKVASLSKDTTEDLYNKGYSYYKHGKYSEAAKCFSTLVIADGTSAKYWNSLAASQLMLKNYKDALTAYALVNEFDSNNPLPCLHMAECLFALHRKEEGLKALDLAQQLAKANNKESDLIDRIEFLRLTWSSK